MFLSWFLECKPWPPSNPGQWQDFFSARDFGEMGNRLKNASAGSVQQPLYVMLLCERGPAPLAVLLKYLRVKFSVPLCWHRLQLKFVAAVLQWECCAVSEAAHATPIHLPVGSGRSCPTWMETIYQELTVFVSMMLWNVKSSDFTDIHSSMACIFLLGHGEGVNECFQYLCVCFCLKVDANLLPVPPHVNGGCPLAVMALWPLTFDKEWVG